MKQAYISYSQNYPHYPQLLCAQNRCFVRKVWEIMWKTFLTQLKTNDIVYLAWIRLFKRKDYCFKSIKDRTFFEGIICVM
jgi:hypothetical protein